MRDNALHHVIVPNVRLMPTLQTAPKLRQELIQRDNVVSPSQYLLGSGIPFQGAIKRLYLLFNAP
ncbi:MAG: hypothetical protein QGG84_10110 [Rhodospirillales bacterium]|nr:hypothetical protein [Rhodospirillales bacterium]